MITQNRIVGNDIVQRNQDGEQITQRLKCCQEMHVLRYDGMLADVRRVQRAKLHDHILCDIVATAGEDIEFLQLVEVKQIERNH